MTSRDGMDLVARSRARDRFWHETGLSRCSRILVSLAALAALGCASPAAAFERRVVVGHDGRIGEEAAAAATGMLPGEIAARYAATGIVECGGMRGIGQLTGRGDVVTSAAHVFFDEAGRSRAESGRCVFLASGIGVEPVPLAPDPRTCGSTSPYASSGHRDWAVARLARRIEGIRPYRIGGAAPKVGQPITVVAFEGRRRTLDFCHIRDVVAGASGGQEIRTDCVGFDGMSGAAYLTNEALPRLIGVHVGYRSRSPDVAAAFAADHYTFGAPVDGSFERAFIAATR